MLAVADHLQSLRRALHGRIPERDLMRICAIQSETLQLAGEILFDAGPFNDASQTYMLAASAAKEAKAFDQWACALTRYSLVCIGEQRWSEAKQLLDKTGVVAARGGSTQPTRQWVSSVQAEIAAAEGDVVNCRGALDSAETVADLPGPIGNGGWLRFYGTRLPEQRAS